MKQHGTRETGQDLLRIYPADQNVFAGNSRCRLKLAKTLSREQKQRGNRRKRIPPTCGRSGKFAKVLVIIKIDLKIRMSIQTTSNMEWTPLPLICIVPEYILILCTGADREKTYWPTLSALHSHNGRIILVDMHRKQKTGLDTSINLVKKQRNV